MRAVPLLVVSVSLLGGQQLEVRFQGERRVVLRKAVQLPLQMFSFHVPQTSHADYPALEVLGAVLSEVVRLRLTCKTS